MAGRGLEFDVWHVECKRQRNILKTINILFLSIVASFTFVLCLLLAAAFSDEEAIRWVQNVLESLLMQVKIPRGVLSREYDVSIFLVNAVCRS